MALLYFAVLYSTKLFIGPARYVRAALLLRGNVWDFFANLLIRTMFSPDTENLKQLKVRRSQIMEEPYFCVSIDSVYHSEKKVVLPTKHCPLPKAGD